MAAQSILLVPGGAAGMVTSPAMLKLIFSAVSRDKKTLLSSWVDSLALLGTSGVLHRCGMHMIPSWSSFTGKVV